MTRGPKTTMAKHLYDAVNPSTINNGDDVSRSQVAPPPSTFSGNTPPSTNQLTATNTTLPPAALQAQLRIILDGSVPAVSSSTVTGIFVLLKKCPRIKIFRKFLSHGIKSFVLGQNISEKFCPRTKNFCPTQSYPKIFSR